MRRILSALFILSSASVAHSQNPAATISFTPFTLRTYDGQTHNIEIGKIAVTRRDTVAFYRLRTTSDVIPSIPTVFLMGGPGVPATVIAPIPPYWQLFDALRSSGDVILLDQRGLGLSSPKVDCPPYPDFDTAFLTSHAKLVAAYRRVVATCAESWRSKGVDPRSYSDIAIADDVEAIRKALNAPKMNVLGFSYGTRLAMTYARRYPQSVGRMVLQGPLDAELGYRDATQRDALLTRIASLAEKDSVSAPFSQNLILRIRALFNRAASAPFIVKIGRAAKRDSVSIAVGEEGLRGILDGHITDPRLAAFVASTERGDLTILSRWVESMYNDFSGGAGSLMARAINCSAQPSLARRKTVDAKAAKTILGAPVDNFAMDTDFCSALGGKPPAAQSRLPKPIQAKVLFITGEFDDRTPPGNDSILAREFTDTYRMKIANGGHELLPNDAVQKIVTDFFQGIDVRVRVVSNSPIRFMSIEDAKQPPRRPGR
ncbi:MAG TPA: alpha/beta fold hydrolase [Gemmatimonadaceae bacterium]|nr:alpha/beta fold hydrolase [Gemmatimonadaceae bacterium]